MSQAQELNQEVVMDANAVNIDQETNILSELVQSIAMMDLRTKEEKKRFLKRFSDFILGTRHCPSIESILQELYDAPASRSFFNKVVKLFPIITGEAELIKIEDNGKAVVRPNKFQSIEVKIQLGYVTVNCLDVKTLVGKEGSSGQIKARVKHLKQSWRLSRDTLFKAVNDDYDKWVYEQDIPNDPSLIIWHGFTQQARKLIEKGGWKNGRKAAAIQSVLDAIAREQ